MTKHILWEPKHMTLFLKENVNICFFNNENTSYKKNYTPCYAPEAALTGGHSSAKGDQFHLPNF